jgi:hypothetical protein
MVAVLVAAALVLIGGREAREASAHGFVDQMNESGAFGTSQINFAEPVGQEFTPSASSLVGVDVQLATMNSTGAADITLRIRSATIGGTVLATAIRSLPQDLGGSVWVHFELPASVALTPGQLYVIELEAPNATHGWRYGGNNYAGGQAITQGSANGNADWMFRTYSPDATVQGDVDCSGTVNSIDALKILRHAAGLSVIQTEPCRDVGVAP